jgi:hypothetical protein
MELLESVGPRPRQARYQAALRPDIIEFYSSLICEFVDSEPVACTAPWQDASGSFEFQIFTGKSSALVVYWTPACESACPCIRLL